MKKDIAYKLLGLAFIIVGMVACDTASQDAEPVISPDGYPIATFVNKTGTTTVDEGDTLVYQVSIDKTIDRSLTFSLKQTGGTCDGDDYSVVPAIIQPYTKTADLLIIFNEDYDFDATETLDGTIGIFSLAEKHLVNPATQNPTISVTVNNYISDILEVALYWSQEVKVLDIVEVELTAEEYGNEYTYTITDTIEITVDVADEVDWDIYVLDGEGATVDAAASSGNPEVLESTLPDGEYIIWADLYSNGLLGYYEILEPELTMPIISFFTRQGTDLIDFKIVQDPSQVPTVDTPGFKENTTGFGGVVCEVHVSGGNYTIVEYDGTQTGPFKGIKFQRPQIRK
jgi:hypothetical protein